MKFGICKIFSLFSLLSILSTSSVKADEGMWVVGTISAETDSVLRSLGLEMTAEELYSSDQPSLNNAIVQLGGFCSGVIVSPDGLMFTNHHCGYGAIQSHSSVKNDYLKNGFIAKKHEDELPNEDLFVLLHLKTIDVTDKILGRIPENATVDVRDSLIDKYSDEIVELVSYNNEGVYGEINPFFKGSKYCLSVYQRYDDVRLVCAPPQCMGKYGGDTDNWMWPRQTCDFSVFRIYAGKDNRPAPYSKDNVPYKPLSFAHVSTQGYKEGDYVMTLGYPGSTDRYLSSYGIYNTMRCENDVRYQVRGVKLDILKKAMDADDAIRIKYASKQSSCSNYWKFSLGQNTALQNLNVLNDKRKLENDVKAWIDSDTVSRKRYVGMLDSLSFYYEKEFKKAYAANLFMESFIGGSDILKFVLYKNMFGGVRVEDSLSFRNKVAETYKDIDVDTDKEIFRSLLKNYISHVPDSSFLPVDLLSRIDSVSQGDIDKFVDFLYSQSVYADVVKLSKVSSFEETAADPMVDVAMDIAALVPSVSGESKTYEYERLLGDAIREMNHSRLYYPDANFTLRLSYGLFKPINFPVGTKGLKEEAESMVTTPQSFLNKHFNESQNSDYELIDPVCKWMKKGKFSSRYIDKNTGNLPLCFLTTNDITGGNSGSGMFDSKGRLVGLAFDGNWEAMSGDIKFDNNLQRCIGVDIRWVLSVIEDYSKGKNLIKELVIE